MRRQLPLFLVFVGGVFMVFQYFVPHESSEWVYEYLLDWTIIIGIFALALGIWSLIKVSVDRINRRRSYWQYSIVTLFGLFAMLIFGWTGTGMNGDYTLANYVVSNQDKLTIIELTPQVSEDSVSVLLEDTTLSVKFVKVGLPMDVESIRAKFDDSTLIPGAHKDWTKAYLNNADSQYYSFVPDSGFGMYFYTKEGLVNPMFIHFFEFILIPVQSTMFSLLAFFIASAAYRAFRARNLLSTLLLFAALIVMLRFMPGPWGDYAAKTSAWVMNVPNMAAQRAIVIGIGLGMVATALKVVLGIERGYMGKG